MKNNFYARISLAVLAFVSLATPQIILTSSNTIFVVDSENETGKIKAFFYALRTRCQHILNAGRGNAKKRFHNVKSSTEAQAALALAAGLGVMALYQLRKIGRYESKVPNLVNNPFLTEGEQLDVAKKEIVRLSSQLDTQRNSNNTQPPSLDDIADSMDSSNREGSIRLQQINGLRQRNSKLERKQAELKGQLKELSEILKQRTEKMKKAAALADQVGRNLGDKKPKSKGVLSRSAIYEFPPQEFQSVLAELKSIQDALNSQVPAPQESLVGSLGRRVSSFVGSFRGSSGKMDGQPSVIRKANVRRRPPLQGDQFRPNGVGPAGGSSGSAVTDTTP